MATKTLKINNIDNFIKIIKNCKDKVELISDYGDVINLNSKLLKYIDLKEMLNDNKIINKLELNVHNINDAEKIKNIYNNINKIEENKNENK